MTSTDSGADDELAIGAVLRLLQPEFPELTVSKIRYLESAGLITPDRRPSGYRAYRRHDVDRLRFALTAQRDRFWPLRVIKDALDRLDRGLPVEGLDPEVPGTPAQDHEPEPGAGHPAADPGPAGSVPGVPTGEALRRRRRVRLTPAQLRTRSGLDAGVYSALTGFGLLRLDSAGRHGADDLDVAREAAALARYGIEARHLRMFRVAADREIGLVQQVLEPTRRRRARGAPGPDPGELQGDILARFLALHVALVRGGLGDGPSS